MIVAQSPPAGRRLEEVALSRQIGVSRTPLREALISLEAEGLVVSEPNKGFSVAPLDEKLVREIYPLLAALEATALERASANVAELLPQLRSVNARLAQETRPKRQYDLDREFHRLLVSACGNERLRRFVEGLWWQARRSDGGPRRGTANRDGSCREHGQILEALAAGKNEKAAGLLRRHWRRGEDVVAAWLRERDRTGEPVRGAPSRSRSRMTLTLLVTSSLAFGSVARADSPSTGTPGQVSLHGLQQEVEIAEVLQRLQATAPHGKIVLRNVQVIDPDRESVAAGQTVIVERGQITWVGDSATAPDAPSTTIIDGKGRFLVPGLVDMHVHSSSAVGWLLDLTNGVTTVRDMDGFPWLLKVRDSVKAGRMLAPINYVAGTIINARPLDGYAVVPRSPDEARQIVREQAECGYDFIKIHNVIPEAMFDAIADEAHRLHLDLIGHVPHDITLDHVLHAGRMRTTEHLKGFLVDQTLLPSDEDFSKALAGAETWITPTLYTRLGYDRGEKAKRVLTDPLAKYVPQRKRAEWAAFLAAAPNSEERLKAEKIGERFRETQSKVMKRLIPLRPRWLAGTDADGYAFNIMGYALIEELQLLQEAGLTHGELIRAATSEPTRAMRREKEFGLISPGLRADLVLLDSNPLKAGAPAFRSNQGVMAHGYWLDRPKLDEALKKLAGIFAQPDADVEINREAVTGVIRRLTELAADGFVFDSSQLDDFAARLRKIGETESADQVEHLAGIPASGPCVGFLPKG